MMTETFNNIQEEEEPDKSEIMNTPPPISNKKPAFKLPVSTNILILIDFVT